MVFQMDKKSLKQSYKTLITPKGIFAIKNLTRGKAYLGSCMNIRPGIWDKNKLQLDCGNHWNSELQKDWNELGEANFKYEVLELLELKEDPTYDYEEDLQILEAIWLDKFAPIKENLYNTNEKIRSV
jgi:hypothetical protein